MLIPIQFRFDASLAVTVKASYTCVGQKHAADLRGSMPGGITKVANVELVQIRPGIDIPSDDIAEFCHRHDITWLAVFGSVLRDDFGPTSDIDLLVEFAPGSTPSLFEMMDLEEELSNLLTGRTIDLGTKRALNRWARDRVLSEARVLYDAA